MSEGDRRRESGPNRVPLSEGTRIRDRHFQRSGVIQEVAKQFAYPQAPPNFVYLVRWDDGQIQALAEAALHGGHGLEIEADDS